MPANQVMVPLLSFTITPVLFYSTGIGKLSTADGKALTDPEVLRKLTSSVSCALDEAAQALHRMRAEQQIQMGNEGYLFLFFQYSKFTVNKL